MYLESEIVNNCVRQAPTEVDKWSVSFWTVSKKCISMLDIDDTKNGDGGYQNWYDTINKTIWIDQSINSINQSIILSLVIPNFKTIEGGY